MAKRKLGRSAERYRDQMKRKRQIRNQVIGFAKDVFLALIIVIIVMASLYAYSGGIWPPMVVVESESMMHGDDSQIGVIDTGDLTLVKKIGSKSDIITYVEGRPSYQVSFEEAGKGTTTETFKGAHAGYMTYSDYGDVIIYRKNGRGSETPVIHRAMVWFVPNTTAECVAKIPHGQLGGADYPDIKNSNHPTGLKCIVQLSLLKVGYEKDEVRINSSNIVINGKNVDGSPITGFLTQGDHNRVIGDVSRCDQETHRDLLNRWLAPIKVVWVVGKAVGELPWFGAMKLVASDPDMTDKIPPSSWQGLIITIILIVTVPFIIDLVIARYSKKKEKSKKKGSIDENEEEENEDDDETEDDEEEKMDDSALKKKKDGKKARAEEVDETVGDDDIDLDDEFGDEFKKMASSKKRKSK